MAAVGATIFPAQAQVLPTVKVLLVVGAGVQVVGAGEMTVGGV